MTNWKAGYNREVKHHEETKKLANTLSATAGQYERNMWDAQRRTQAAHVQFEEAERQRVAAVSLVDGLQSTNARLQAERDLLLLMMREWIYKK